MSNLPQPETQVKPLRPNPFTTYRDPQTGQWVVVKPERSS